MEKKTEASFWKSETPPDSWEELVQYVKPRTAEELDDFFAPKPPNHTDVTEISKKEEANLLEQLKVTPEEFVELAFQSPEMWDEEELDYLQTVAANGIVDERLDDLAKEYFYGKRERKQEEQPINFAAEPPLDMNIELPPELPSMDSIPDLDVLEKTVNVDRWWEKK